MGQETGVVLLIGEGHECSCDQIHSVLSGFRSVCHVSSTASVMSMSLAEVSVAILMRSTPITSDQIQLIQRLSDASIGCIVLATEVIDAEAISFFKAGALDVIEYPEESFRLHDSLARADTLYRQHCHNRVMRRHAEQLQELTPRERNLVDLVAQGCPNKQIAKSVGLSVKSIERIRREAYKKLNVRSTAEMTRVVILGGMFDGTANQPAGMV